MEGTHRINRRTRYFHQLLNPNFRDLSERSRRTTFPAAEQGSPEQRPSLEDFRILVERLRRSIVLFMIGVLGYGTTLDPMLPHDPTAGVLGFLTMVLMGLALVMQRRGLTPSPATRPLIVLESINPGAHRRQLSDLLDRIMLADFS